MTNRKFKESKYRVRQAAKITIELMHCLENMSKVSRQKMKTEFVAPIEMDRKNVHWEEFATSARRVIFTLKTELSHFSHDLNPDMKIQVQRSDNSFRFLISASKKCIQLFKGLEKFPNEIQFGKRGYRLKDEVTSVTHKLILFMSLFGIIPANIDIKKFNEKTKVSNGQDISICEDVNDTSLNISSSDLDSDAACILETENIRQKLSNLAEAHLAKNKKHKKGKIAFKTILPLKKIQKTHLGVTEDLADGRKVQFIHDSLSHKLRRRNFLTNDNSHGQHKQNRQLSLQLKAKEVEHYPNSQATVPRYGISERAADIAFESLLPHFNGRKALIENNNPLVAGEMEWNSLQIKLNGLSERLIVVEKAIAKREKFAKHLGQLISSWVESEGEFMDISKAIKQASIALEKVSAIKYIDTSDKYAADIVQLGDKNLYTREHNVPVSGTRIQGHFCASSNLDLNLRSKLNEMQSLSNFPSLQEELQAKRNEFWTSLVENNYIKPPKLNSFNKQPINSCLPISEEANLNSKCYDYNSKYTKLSKETQIGESLSEELDEIDREVSDAFLPSLEAEQDSEVSESNTDQNLVLEVKDKNTDENCTT